MALHRIVKDFTYIPDPATPKAGVAVVRDPEAAGTLVFSHHLRMPSPDKAQHVLERQGVALPEVEAVFADPVPVNGVFVEVRNHHRWEKAASVVVTSAGVDFSPLRGER